MNIRFNVHSYDKDGNLLDPGIFLHFGDRFSLKLRDIASLEGMINNLTDIRSEIIENHNIHQIIIENTLDI